ncbi:MAG: peptidoglycan-binding protein, partial [Patescibacteria group bacterium]|nr:peptidoglycan-binding protein [Patescibacteria group bacterium]
MYKRLLLLTSVCMFAPFFVFAAARSLSVGLSGSDVTTLQQELIAQGYLSGSATGYFGALTQAAVQKFQCARGIICAGSGVSGYGIAGPKTQAALASASAPVQPGTLSGVSLTNPATGKFEFSGWLPYWRAATS